MPANSRWVCGSTSPGVTAPPRGIEPGEPPERVARRPRAPPRPSPRGPTAAMRPSQQATTGASGASGPPTSAADSRPTSPCAAPARTPPASVTTSAAPTIRRPGRRLVAPAALDDPERSRRVAAAQSGRAGPGGLEPQLERLHRREVAQPEEAGRGGQPRLDRVVARRAGVVGDGEERGQRREPDQLRLGELDAVLGGDVADGLPDQPERRRPRSRGGSSRPGRDRSSSIQKPLAWTFGRPPPDSRTRRAIRLASSTSVDVEVDVVGDEERPRADGDRAGRRVQPRRAEVGLAAALRDLGLEALVLAAPDVGQLDPLGPRAPPRRRGRPAGRSGPRSARRTSRASSTQSSIVVVAERHERDDVDRADPRVLAGVRVHVDLVDRRRRRAARARRRPAPCSPASVNTERLWLASLVRSRRWTLGHGLDRVGQPVDDVEAASLGDVRDGFDQRSASSGMAYRDMSVAADGDRRRRIARVLTRVRR